MKNRRCRHAPTASAQTLEAAFAPARVEVRDDSHRHAGHAGAAPGGETHYSVLAVSPAFAGMNRVARSRAVHAVLAAEFGARAARACAEAADAGGSRPRVRPVRSGWESIAGLALPSPGRYGTALFEQDTET